MTKTIIRDYRQNDAQSVGQLIADTYGQYNLDFLPEESRAPFLGPFQHAYSPDEAHRQAIEHAPRHAPYHMNLADTLLRQDLPHDAARAVDAARALDPTHPLLPMFTQAVKLRLSEKLPEKGGPA